MLKIPNFSRFRNGEFVKFNDMSISVLHNHDLKALQLSEIAQEVISAGEAMKAVYKTDRGSMLTKAIVHADITRDNMYSAMTQHLRIDANYHFQKEMQKKAETLLHVFEKHGRDLNRQSYHQQTANIDDIAEDVKRKGLWEIIEAFHLEPFYNKLLEANKEFDRLYLERNKEYAQTPEESMPELRDKAESALKNLFDRVNAFIIINGSENYQSLVNEFNALIDNYETSIERRLSLGEDEHKEESELNQDFEESVE